MHMMLDERTIISRRQLDRLDWNPEGHSFWDWEVPGHGPARIHYVASGPSDGKPLVLVHGFGANYYHWRHNVPALSKRYRVYAVDLLGFGLSDKPIVLYSGQLWAQQLSAFIREVVRPVGKAAIAGNSLGGYASLATAVEAPELVSGVALLNAAGRFSDGTEPSAREAGEGAETEAEAGPGYISALTTAVQEQIQKAFTRLVLGVSFQVTKQPARVRQVLEQVYASDPSNVDDELVQSILHAAKDKNAQEVFCRIVSRNALPTVTIDDLLSRLDPEARVLLLWGEKDPWIRPAVADRIQELRPCAQRVSLDAGHCPHDEAPEEVNRALEEWVESLLL